MAEITLRSYSQEVDGLIELEQLDEAIAHCRQILQAFPKHLDTYRSLGKAYLEAKRYGDASDIFQRVLSSEPADFVSHIGMSVIREDAGNLDSAIWHMERAFENNPANQVIQQELKRLFGQRDGSEPTKVRLTRGALARMYANGELYPQAVAELRAALEEDPERADLRILLAEMHWQLNQQLEAAEICSQVLEKLPHCREANRIMAAVLQASGKGDAASVYLRRLAAIDPYTAFLESPADDIALVDADSVTLEKLEWQAGEEIEEVVRSKPDWATSLGTEDDIDDTGSVDTAEWRRLVSALPTEDEEVPEELADTSSLETEDDASIPEWLRDGGWNEATGEATEEPISFSDEEIAMLEAGVPAGGNLARADIPDWLKDIAPVSVTDPDAADTTERIDTPPAPPEDDPEEGERELPEWLAGIAEDVRREEEEAEPAPPFDEDQPDEEIVIPEAPPEPAPEPTPEPIAETPPEPAAEAPSEPASEERRQLPTWLEESEPGGAETILTWLGSRDRPDDPDDETARVSTTDQQPDADTSSWLNGVAEAAAQEQPGFGTGEERLDPTKAVTRELSPEMLERFGRPPDVEDVEVEETPEPIGWEPEFDEPEAPEPAPEPSPPADEPASGTLAGEGIGWLDTLAGIKPPEPPQEEEPEVPTWLRELAPDTDDLPGEVTPITPAAQDPVAPPVESEPPAEVAEPVTEPPAEVAEPVAEPEPPAEVAVPVAEPEPPAEVAEPVAEPEPPAHEASTVAELPEPVPPFIEEAPEGEIPESEPLPEAVDAQDIPAPIDEPAVAESAPEPEAAAVPDTPAPIEESPKPSSTQKLSEERAAEKLATARIALESGDVQTAANEYQALIRAKYHLNEVIDTIQRALERYPNTPILWQVLGDAHMKADQLNDAMDAYRQGLDTI